MPPPPEAELEDGGVLLVSPLGLARAQEPPGPLTSMSQKVELGLLDLLSSLSLGREGGREGGSEGGSEGGREGGREAGRQAGRQDQ